MSFFRGYVRVKNKRCIDPYKDAPLRTLEQVQECESYAGVLTDDTVLIDIDDETQANKLLTIVKAKGLACQVRKTTRGMHFFFKNDGTWTKCATGVTLAIGLKADIKVGVTNCYSILKKDGVVREVIQDIDPFLDGDYQAPPKWLKVVKSNVSVVNIHEGEGRNTKLFSYILSLQRHKFTREEVIETLGVINEFIFDEPLSKREFETVTRDEAFQSALTTSFFDDDGKFLFEQFALYLISELHIKRINGQLHFYDNGTYVSGQLKIENAMLAIIPTLRNAQRTEVFKYIDVMCCEEVDHSDAHLVAFDNGVYDLKADKLLPFSPDYIITNRIPWDYNPNAYSEVVDKTLTKLACGDEEVRKLLEEVAGYTFFRRNELRKSFILTGADGNNGKSTYINMIGTMLGSENISAIDLGEIHEKFITTELFGRLANLGDDIGEAYIENSSVFKKLVSGDKVLVQFKGERPFYFSNYAKLIFCANAIPRVKDKSGAVLSRLIIIPFDASFSKSDPDFDPFISDKLASRESIEYLIQLGLKAVRGVLSRYAFTESQKVKKALEEYNEENNPILTFLDELETSDLLRNSIGDLYLRYQIHCSDYGVKEMSRSSFTRFILRKHPNMESRVVKIDGKCSRFFANKRVWFF